MNQSPVVHHRAGPLLGAKLDQPVGAMAMAMVMDVVVLEPEFAAGADAAFPEVRLVRARCGAGAASCEARCPAGSRQIAAGRDAGAASWVMCA